MSGNNYQILPRVEADAIQESTAITMKKAEKLIDNLKFRLGILQSNLTIEQNVIRDSEAYELFTNIAFLSDEVFSALRSACNQLNSLSNVPPALELRPDPEEEKKRYYRNVVLPQDQVASHLTDNAIFVRTPMLWSRNNRRIRGGKGRTIGPEKCTIYRDSVYYSLVLDPEFQSYDFSKYKKKIIHFLYIYHDLPLNRIYLIDNDNHETKHVTDAIVRLLPAGDTPLNCNFYSSAMLTDRIAEGSYVTVTTMEDGLMKEDDIVSFWAGKCQRDAEND